MIRIVGFLLAIITYAPTFCQKQNERLEISADAHGFIAFAPRSWNLSSDGILELRKFRNWLQSNKTPDEYNITLYSLSPNSEADKFSGILRCKAILDSLTIHGIDPSIFYIGKDVSSDAENGVQFIIDDKYRTYISPTTKLPTKEPRKPSVYKKYKNNFFDIQSSDPQLTDQGEKQLADFKKWIAGGKHSYIVNLYGIDSQNNAGNLFALKACKVIMDRLSGVKNISLVFIRPQKYPRATRKQVVYFTLEVGQFDEGKVKDDEFFKQ